MNKKHTVLGIQTSDDPFAFDEFSTEEKNQKFTKQWIEDSQHTGRVWLKDGLSVFRGVDEKYDIVRYFAVNFDVQPWTTVYCVKLDYATIPPLRVACQVGVWSDDRDISTVGLAKDVFWKLIFKRSDIVTDSIQTSHGRRFWRNRIAEAFKAGLYVYSMRIKDDKIKDAFLIKDLEAFNKNQNKIWGPKVTDRYKRIAICKDELKLKSYQKYQGQLEGNVMAQVLPKAWTEAGSKTKVNARVDMSEEVAGAGLCPVTKKPMVRMFANGHPVLVSMDARVVLPVKDD